MRGHVAEPFDARGLVVGIGFEVGSHLGCFHLNFEVQRAEFTEGSRRRLICRWLSGRKIFRPDVLFPHFRIRPDVLFRFRPDVLFPHLHIRPDVLFPHSPRRYFDSVPA